MEQLHSHLNVSLNFKYTIKENKFIHFSFPRTTEIGTHSCTDTCSDFKLCTFFVFAF